jgi:Flp pilus assembly pilin Flp
MLTRGLGYQVRLNRALNLPPVATNANRRLRKEAGIVFSFLRREEGQGLAEYAIIGSLIAVLAVLALTFIGSTLFKVLSVVGQGV